MLRKLLSLYKNSILFSNRPENPPEELFIFCNETDNEWIGIPKAEVNKKELNLLKTIFKLVEVQVPFIATPTQEWYEFLLLDGPLPRCDAEKQFRFIQFEIGNYDVNQSEIESALKGFFTEEVIIVWESSNRGVVIEEKTQISLSEEELISMSETLESDFYMKTSFFIGKLHYFSEQLRLRFLQEKDYFSFGITNLGTPNIFTFERIIPAYLGFHLPEELKLKITEEIIDIFQDDPEMFSTIMVFLENNLNASLTAKKLYIHRNTLQYRLDKFSEKTGIGLKDFYGAFTVFLACILFEQKRNK